MRHGQRRSRGRPGGSRCPLRPAPPAPCARPAAALPVARQALAPAAAGSPAAALRWRSDAEHARAPHLPATDHIPFQHSSLHPAFTSESLDWLCVDKSVRQLQNLSCVWYDIGTRKAHPRQKRSPTREDQMTKGPGVSRRNVLLTGGAAMAAFPLSRAAFGQDFPSRNVEITIPTGEGGGADRDSRLFTASWRKRLDTNFEFEFYPGAAGQVGYQFYLRKEPNPHDLLFANLGPEVIMLTLQALNIKVGTDIVYIRSEEHTSELQSRENI